MSGDKVEVPDVKEFVRYLGFSPGDRDCKSAGGDGYLIPCPFHNDTNPSMGVYHDGAWCYSGCGGKYYNLAYLASEIKGISYGQALKDLGAERLTQAEKMVDYRPPEILHYCEPNPDNFIKAFQQNHERCSKDYPPEMVAWLERKKLLEQAKKLDWRWHDGSVYKHWGKGVVIPYCNPKTGEIEYERFRAWNEKEQKFDKVISPNGTTGQPYWNTFRALPEIHICEGESDCASVYAIGGSAVGIPGSTAKKVINTVLATLNDISLIQKVICCGDEDAAGRGMNLYIQEAAQKIAPRLQIMTYEHVLHDKKADMNDEYVKGVLRLPDALKTQKQGSELKVEEVKDSFDFDKYVDKLSAYLYRCELYGVDPWKKDEKGIGVLNPHAITDSLAPLAEKSYIVVENTRGKEVLIPKFHTSGLEHFMLQINNGEHAGVYEVVLDAISMGWQEEQKTPSGAVQMMQVLRVQDLINIEDLDFEE